MEEKLKIGIFIDTFFPMVDGVINVVDNYAKRLCKFCDVTVFAPAPREKFDDGKFEYKVVRRKRVKLTFMDYDLPIPQIDRKFKKAIENANLDIVHIHSPFSVGKIGVSYAKKHNIPIVATMHSQYKQDFYKATKSKLITNILLKKIMKVFNACDECFAVNAKIAEIFKGYGANVLPSVANNGTDMELVEKKEAFEVVNKKFNLKENEFVFLFVGRLIVLKNILFIVEALRLVKEKGFNFKMLFVGSGPDENLLREKIKELKLEENVILCGKICDRDLIAKIYRRAHLFLFPSLYDASSLVQIEAASQKTPTVFLEGAATANTVINEVNGFIVKNDLNAFSDKIIETMKNEKFYNGIAENAYRDLFVSWDTCVEKTYKEYLKHINKKAI